MLKKLALVPRLLAALAVVVVLGVGAHQALATPVAVPTGCPCDFNDPEADEFCQECCMSEEARCSVANICVC